MVETDLQAILAEQHLLCTMYCNYLNSLKGSDEFPVGPARNSTQGCFAHDLHFEDLIDA